jgi:four helix bundle protein
VAEGWCRKHRREYAQGVNIAVGSSGEFQTLVELSKDLVYVTEPEFKEFDAKIEHLRAMLLTLYGKLV